MTSRFAILRGVPGYWWMARVSRQLLGVSPFEGDIQPRRVRIFWPGSGRATSPFPHPWNYKWPLSILESFFWQAETETGTGRHNRYLEMPGFAPVLVTRDPAVIRAIATETGDQPGQFDRDTLPTGGIARATGVDTLLYANGGAWKRQKKVAAPPFARSTLFQPEQFHGFEETFRQTARARLEALERLIEQAAAPVRVAVEPELKAVMLEMLTNNFFGAEIPYEEIRGRFVPALEQVIDHIVRDTVINKMGIPLRWVPSVTRRIAAIKASYAAFEELTDLVIAPRAAGRGLWKQFKSEAPDGALRGNIRVFLAGALEATTSYAAWAIAHLSRNTAAQERVFEEVKDMEDYTPAQLDRAKYLGQVLNETLRLTPALYFLPRRATMDCWVETAGGSKLKLPKGTHVLLDVWHANRHEDHWGVAVTGYPAEAFVPERWDNRAGHDHGSKELLHFGFGHGPRFCPGKNLGQMEVALAVGAFVKLFRFKAVNAACRTKAGVSTKPGDGVLVEMELRGYKPERGADLGAERAAVVENSRPGCPFHGQRLE